MSKNNTEILEISSAMIGSARNTLARPGSGERRILGALSLIAQTSCDGRSKTSRHNTHHSIKI